MSVKQLAMVSLLVLQAGCVVHKLDGTASLDEKTPALVERRATGADASLVVTPLSTWPEGEQCFEPMLYVLSLGLIPTHCVRRYHVGYEAVGDVDPASLETHVTVTSMQGWIPALFPVLQGWRYGAGLEPDEDIRLFIESRQP